METLNDPYLIDPQPDAPKASGFVSLWKYKIKDRKRFLDQNHPQKLDPASEEYKKYWGSRLPGYIEGVWVDDDGTWVFMPPKLNFYINHLIIEDDDRNAISPWLRDIEWIAASYFLCVDGFSGFEDDPDYTCNYLVEKVQDKTIKPHEKKKLPDSVYREDGSFKEYIEPWHYLTEYYLLENPRGPLGRPRYDNPRTNAMIFSGRSIGKTLLAFLLDFCHEWTFSSVRYMENIGNVNKRLFFAMAAKDSRPLSRSIQNISAALTRLPGSYNYPSDSRGKRRKPVLGAFYKTTQGPWSVKGETQHLVKRPDNTIKINGSTMQSMILDVGAVTVAAGDRFRRIYIEEAGFIGNLIDIFNANTDSLKIGSKIVGSFVMTGTAGDMENIIHAKRMFENPDGYRVFGIPNYWDNDAKHLKLGLFIPSYYKFEEFRDENGNTDVDAAANYLLEFRDNLMKTTDSVSYASEVMFNPIAPPEMLRPSGGNVLPKLEAAEQLSAIRSQELIKRNALIGELVYDNKEDTGIRFKRDMSNKLSPIMTYDVDSKQDMRGAFVMYENPPYVKPKNLYWVVYDPAAQDGAGSSLHSLLVYKYYHGSEDGTRYDTIIAEWIGRYDTLEENYEMVLKVAKYFNARIFPEVNVAGFVSWMSSNGHYNMLEGDARTLEKEINPNGTRNVYNKGVRIDKRKKNWALHRARSWLMEEKTRDERTGLTSARTINWILSPRLLSEIVAYNDTGNFDHISSLIVLMILLAKLEGMEHVQLEDPYADERYEGKAVDYVIPEATFVTARRCSLLNY